MVIKTRSPIRRDVITPPQTPSIHRLLVSDGRDGDDLKTGVWREAGSDTFIRSKRWKHQRVMDASSAQQLFTRRVE